jgi:hypothetical protein
MVTNSSDVQHAVIRDLAPSHACDAATGADAGLTNASAAACVALTGMKLQEVWDGDTQVCVEVVEAGNHSGVHAGDLLRTVEGVDCSKRSIAEVGRLIAEANAGKLTVTLGMLHMSKAPNKREEGGVEEAGGGAGGDRIYSVILERRWLTDEEDEKGGEEEEEREAEAVLVLKGWGLWPLPSQALNRALIEP